VNTCPAGTTGWRNADREFAHDAGAEKAPAEAKERGRTVVSMPNDVKVVFDL
jgi:hypothetical protein